MLDENVLKNRSTPPVALIAEIGNFFQQKLQVPRLMKVEFGRDPGPRAVIHPGAGNPVAIGDKFPRLISDDRRVRPVHSHPGEIVQQKSARISRIHQQKG